MTLIGQRAGAVQGIVRPVLAVEAGAGVELWRLAGAHRAGQGHGLAHPRRRFIEVGAVLQGAGDPGIQLRVVVLPPPVVLRPAGIVARRGEGAAGIKCAGVEAWLQPGIAAAVQAAGQGEQAGEQGAEATEIRAQDGRSRTTR